MNTTRRTFIKILGGGAAATQLGAAPAFAQDAPPALSATYVCDGGAVLQAAYINPETGPGLAVVAWAGVPLKR